MGQARFMDEGAERATARSGLLPAPIIEELG